MENTRINSEFYAGCMLGATIGNSIGENCQRGGEIDGNMSSLQIGGLMQLALFTAEGLLRATHRAKMHGTNGTFAEIIYESYQRWLKTQSVDFDKLGELPKNDGWLIRRREMYHKDASLLHTPGILKSNIPGEIGRPINYNTDYEGFLRVFPVGLMFPGDPKLSFRVASEATALTHGAAESYLSGGFFAALVSAMAGGMIFTQAIETALEVLGSYPGADTIRTAITDVLYLIDDLKDMPAKEAESFTTRFVQKIEEPLSAPQVLAFGLFCVLRNPDSYKDAIKQVAQYTAAPYAVGMLAGSISGLKLGETSLPEEWLVNLMHRDIVIQVAEDLLTGIKGEIFVVDREWLTKYPGW